MDFEVNFRSAETLIKVYRLLNTENGPQVEHPMMQGVKDLLMAQEDEEIILLLNELFLGAVRENADVRPAVFRQDNLCMLLRQAVVASCAAVDVYFLALLKTHLPTVIGFRQRNFLPNDRAIRDFLRDFGLSLEEILRVISEPKPETVLGDLLFEYLRRKTLSNSQGVAVSLQILGVDDPWLKISMCLGQPKDALMRQFESLVSRRNDIVHRSDRSAKDPDGSMQQISFAWTDSHVRTARGIVLASDEIVSTFMKSLGPNMAASSS
jgi:hypothetical protein